MLSDSDIKNVMAADMFSIEPYDDLLLQPASIDMRLDSFFYETESRTAWETHPQIIDPSIDQSDYCVLHKVERDGYYDLFPNRVVLGSTYEYVKVSHYLAAKVEGKSSLGRQGLLVHSTAGFIDPGFEGNITLELVNLNDRPIRLWAGMKIAQICLFKLHSSPEGNYGAWGYGSRYQGQRGPTPSRAHERFIRGLP